jgi:hypothetical protein
LRLALGDVLEVWNFRANCDASLSCTTIPSMKHVPARLNIVYHSRLFDWNGKKAVLSERFPVKLQRM